MRNIFFHIGENNHKFYEPEKFQWVFWLGIWVQTYPSCLLFLQQLSNLHQNLSMKIYADVNMWISNWTSFINKWLYKMASDCFRHKNTNQSQCCQQGLFLRIIPKVYKMSRIISLNRNGNIHHENHRATDRGRQNTCRTDKPPLYNHV